jgi:hypothetical protein
MFVSTAAAITVPQPPSASVIVIADVDGILRHGDIQMLAEARSVVEEIGGAPLVLCSSRGAAELMALQRDLGIRHPFISGGGSALHIPSGYFCGTVASDAPDEFETIDFGVRRLGHAVRLVIALFRTCPAPPLVVGIGFEWRDRVILREADVPVVIRDVGIDQTGLLRNVPHAYLTDACGGAGFTEALVGHSSVGRA